MNPSYNITKLASCLLMALILCRLPAFSQDSTSAKIIDVARIKTAVLIKDSSFWQIENADEKNPGQLQQFPFNDTFPDLKNPSVIDKTVYLKFRVNNSHDTT